MLHVRQIGDEILHTPPSKAGFIQHNLLQGYITILQETENLYGGVGIACNQCAKISDPLQIFSSGVNDEKARKILKRDTLMKKFLILLLW